MMITTRVLLLFATGSILEQSGGLGERGVHSRREGRWRARGGWSGSWRRQGHTARRAPDNPLGVQRYRADAIQCKPFTHTHIHTRPLSLLFYFLWIHFLLFVSFVLFLCCTGCSGGCDEVVERVARKDGVACCETASCGDAGTAGKIKAQEQTTTSSSSSSKISRKQIMKWQRLSCLCYCCPIWRATIFFVIIKSLNFCSVVVFFPLVSSISWFPTACTHGTTCLQWSVQYAASRIYH